MKKKDDLRRQVSEAIVACQEKQAEDVTILQLEKDSGAFTDYFVMCSGTNPRQVQAISDAVDERLEALGLRVTHSEGYKQAEWVLLDYVDFVVHIFSEKARQFYDLERLWKSATRIEPAEFVGEAESAAGIDCRIEDCRIDGSRTKDCPTKNCPTKGRQNEAGVRGTQKTAKEKGLKCAPRIQRQWGSSFRLVAAEKWKAKSATMGRAVTEASG